MQDGPSAPDRLGRMNELCCARRAFLRTTAAGAAGVAGLSLAACGNTSDDGAEPGAEATHAGESWEAVLAAEELPVGTSVAASAGEHELLLHRAGEDEVHAFTSVCTHQAAPWSPKTSSSAAPATDRCSPWTPGSPPPDRRTVL
ncbi:hypothetical protein BCY76_000610 [Nesterenkonia sp. PF2B19]|nr:hypothetical protein BCY76_000610 [Nesterenkonia sp. PF2B19]